MAHQLIVIPQLCLLFQIGHFHRLLNHVPIKISEAIIMFKNLSPTTKLFAGLILLVVFIIEIMISVSGN